MLIGELNSTLVEKIPKDWLEHYYKKSGDTSLSGDFLVLISNVGFFTFQHDTNENILYLHNVYGNGKKLFEVVKEVKNKLKASKVIFATKRNFKTFERKYKAKVIGYIMELDIG
ncbi:MAG: hypothetical protein ACP5PT_00840 [Brevinematia bacterium]